MTVSSSTDRETFQGNGVTTSFPLPFRFFSNSDVQVQLINNATQVSTPQTLGIHYSLAGAGEPEVDGNAESTLTMFFAPPTGFSLFAQRVMEPLQPTDIVNQGRFLPEIHENVFDRLTMLIQQAFGFLSDCLSRPTGKNYYDAKGLQIKNLGAPTQATDAANLAAVDQAVASEAAIRAAADASLQAQISGTTPLSASAFSPISWHDQVITNSVNIPADKNAWSFGPLVTVAPGQTVTVGANSFWTIANGEVNQ